MTSRETPIQCARMIVLGITLLVLAGCTKKSAQAVVLDKEHIAAAESSPSPAPDQSLASPTLAADSEAAPTLRELRPDEVVVNGYVMHQDVRGTSRDPRAGPHESWLVRVQFISGGRTMTVHADQEQYEKLKPGDRVDVSYREGKYTGTVWGSEIK